MIRIAGAALAALFVATTAGAETLHMYSYDPADAETRAASGPMTFEFRKGLLKSTVLSVRSTEADATVDLTPVPNKTLAGRSLVTLAGAEAADRELYSVKAADEGTALISVLCPGSSRGWLAIGRPRYGQDLGVDVLGDGPSGSVRLCKKLAFTFHGEWKLPPGRNFDPRLLETRPRGPSG